VAVSGTAGPRATGGTTVRTATDPAGGSGGQGRGRAFDSDVLAYPVLACPVLACPVLAYTVLAYSLLGEKRFEVL